MRLPICWPYLWGDHHISFKSCLKGHSPLVFSPWARVLFLAYINDIPTCLEYRHVLFFVYDAILHKQITMHYFKDIMKTVIKNKDDPKGLHWFLSRDHTKSGNTNAQHLRQGKRILTVSINKYEKNCDGELKADKK